MRKHCDLYYTIKKVGVKERSNSTPIPLYAWFIREKDGRVIQSSYDTGEDDEEREYDNYQWCETDCRDAIEDYYR